MGLDNGFYVKSNKREIKREDLPEGIVYPFSEDYGGVPEIVYWRKCWGLRGMTLDIATPKDEKEYYYVIDTPAQVIELIKGLVQFMDEDYWEENADSIWTYDEFKAHLEEDLINFALILSYMNENPDVYLEFYDSY